MFSSSIWCLPAPRVGNFPSWLSLLRQQPLESIPGLRGAQLPRSELHLLLWYTFSPSKGPSSWTSKLSPEPSPLELHQHQAVSHLLWISFLLYRGAPDVCATHPRLWLLENTDEQGCWRTDWHMRVDSWPAGGTWLQASVMDITYHQVPLSLLPWPWITSWSDRAKVHSAWRFWMWLPEFEGFPSSSDGEESACNAGDLLLIPGSGRTPGEGNGNPL